MGKLVVGLNQSLDGCVDHDAFAPDAALLRHFTDPVRGLAGSLYGRRMYEVMRYWDADRPAYDAAEREFAWAWREQRTGWRRAGSGKSAPMPRRSPTIWKARSAGLRPASMGRSTSPGRTWREAWAISA